MFCMDGTVKPLIIHVWPDRDTLKKTSIPINIFRIAMQLLTVLRFFLTAPLTCLLKPRHNYKLQIPKYSKFNWYNSSRNCYLHFRGLEAGPVTIKPFMISAILLLLSCTPKLVF